MEHSATLSQFAGFGLAWLLVVGWFGYRAWRRGAGLLWVIIKMLVSLALAAGLVLFIRQKMDCLTGDFSGDAPYVLLIIGLVVTGGVVLSGLWTKEIADLVAAPLANVFDGGSEPPEPKPK